MINPTPKDFDNLIARLAKAGWIYEGVIIDDASREHPFGLMLTDLGKKRLRYLYRSLLELGHPGLTEGEWISLLGLVLRHGQRQNKPKEPPQHPPRRS